MVCLHRRAEYRSNTTEENHETSARYTSHYYLSLHTVAFTFFHKVVEVVPEGKKHQSSASSACLVWFVSCRIHEQLSCLIKFESRCKTRSIYTTHQEVKVLLNVSVCPQLIQISTKILSLPGSSLLSTLQTGHLPTQCLTPFESQWVNAFRLNSINKSTSLSAGDVVGVYLLDWC